MVKDSQDMHSYSKNLNQSSNEIEIITCRTLEPDRNVLE
jgi:hypothetical protein